MLANYSEYLSRTDNCVRVLTYSPLISDCKAPFRERIYQNVEVIRIPWIGKGLFNILESYPLLQFFYLVPMLFVALFFMLLCGRAKPDIIHAFGLSAVAAGGLASRIFRIPCMADMCTVYRFPERPMLARLVRPIVGLVDFIRGNSPQGRDELVGIGVSEKKIGLISPPVDEHVFKPISRDLARSRIGRPLKRFVTLFVGRMVKSKNVELAVAAVKLVRNPDISFIFIGDGPLRGQVEELAREDDRVIVIGSVEHHSLVDFYNAADILICGAVDKDLLSFVAREALMCGLPILSVNVAVYAGIPYKVNPDIFPVTVGYLVDATPTSVADTLTKILLACDGNFTIKNRQDCAQFALRNFSQAVMGWVGDSYKTTTTLFRQRSGR